MKNILTASIIYLLFISFTYGLDSFEEGLERAKDNHVKETYICSCSIAGCEENFDDYIDPKEFRDGCEQYIYESKEEVRSDINSVIGRILYILCIIGWIVFSVCFPSIIEWLFGGKEWYKKLDKKYALQFDHDEDITALIFFMPLIILFIYYCIENAIKGNYWPLIGTIITIIAIIIGFIIRKHNNHTKVNKYNDPRDNPYYEGEPEPPEGYEY